MVPKWAQAYLNRSDEEIVLAALAAAQNKTGIAIVPVVIKGVSRFRGYLIGILSGILGFAVVCIDPESYFLSGSEWYQHLNPILFVASVGLSIYLAKFSGTMRLLIPAIWIDEDVRRRALLEFYHQQRSLASVRPGILLIVSLFDRRVVLVSDPELSEVLGPELTDSLCDKLVISLKDGQLGLGFSEAIREIGTGVAEVLPSIQPAVSSKELDGVIFKTD